MPESIFLDLKGLVGGFEANGDDDHGYFLSRSVSQKQDDFRHRPIAFTKVN